MIQIKEKNLWKSAQKKNQSCWFSDSVLLQKKNHQNGRKVQGPAKFKTWVSQIDWEIRLQIKVT